MAALAAVLVMGLGLCGSDNVDKTVGFRGGCLVGAVMYYSEL